MNLFAISVATCFEKKDDADNSGNRPLARFGYWSIRTVVAPEPYIDINIEPGREFTWTYTYDYYTTK